MAPQLDEDLGRVVLPYDRFSLDNADVAVLRQAVNVSVAVCAREQGIDFVASPMFDDVDVYRGKSHFGPWTMAQAEKFGFIEPMRDADLRANGYVSEDYGRPSDPAWTVAVEHNASVIEAHSDALDACSETAQPILAPIREAPNAPWQTELWEARDSLPQSADFIAVVGELEGCLRERGLAPLIDQPGFVEGSDINKITEEQIALAVEVVECKEEVDFTRRVAVIQSDLEAPVLRKYAAEIVAQGKSNATALDEAWALIDANKDALTPLG